MFNVNLIIWRFEVDSKNKNDFERFYGPNGDWAQLFGRSPGFLGTELVCLTSSPTPSKLASSSPSVLTYLTLDRWRSAAEFDDFYREFAAPYQALDARCEALTLREEKYGVFEPVGGA